MKGSSEQTLIVVAGLITAVIVLALLTMYGDSIVKLLGGLFDGMTRSFQAVLCGMLGNTGKLIFGGLC